MTVYIVKLSTSVRAHLLCSVCENNHFQFGERSTQSHFALFCWILGTSNVLWCAYLKPHLKQMHFSHSNYLQLPRNHFRPNTLVQMQTIVHKYVYFGTFATIFLRLFHIKIRLKSTSTRLAATKESKRKQITENGQLHKTFNFSFVFFRF